MSISKECKNLYFAQNNNLNNIYQKMLYINYNKYKKNDHWIWWVFPTTKVGNNDIYKSGITNIDDMIYILNKKNTMVIWVNILIYLSKCLKSQKTKLIFPKNDHNRINIFFDEWIKEYKNLKKYKDFYNAFKLFYIEWYSI